MKFTKMIIISAFIVIGVGFFCGNTYAGNEDYICSVDQVGAKGESETRIMLSDVGGAFSQKWFVASQTRGKEMLSIALTALIADLQVQIRADLESASNPQISRFYILSPE